MSDSSDWHDPFAEDEAARERERRRAEREARRRERQGSVATKVQEQQAEQVPEAKQPSALERPAEPSAPPPGAPAEPAAPPARAASTAESATAPASASEPVAPPPRRSRRPTLGDMPPSGVLWFRRVLAVAVLVIALYGVSKGVGAVVDRVGGDDDTPEQAATPPAKTEDFLVQEGLTRREIADSAKKAGLKGDYMEASKKPPKDFRLKKYAPDGAPNLEGFLFPATYPLEKKATARELVRQQLTAFEDNFRGVDLSYAKSKNLSSYDVLTIASMVEREIQVPEERKLAAAVIYNRLGEGMPLQIDATVRYAIGNFKSPLTESELQTESPYNTYTNPGLPPGPIGNPGLASIEAAAKPAKKDFLYYVVKPGTCGEHVFTASAAEFDEAVAKYRNAQEEAGGSPTEC